MMRTVKAIVDRNGQIKLMEPVELHESQQLLLTVLEEDDEQFINGIPVTALLSEPALAEYWDRPEEDEAWKHLQDR